MDTTQIERAVIGAALGGRCIDDLADVAAWLAPSDFFHEHHRRVWRALLDVHSSGGAVDVVTVFKAGGLSKGWTGDVSAVAWLGEVTAEAAHLFHLDEYARALKALATSRAAASILGDELERARLGEASVDEIKASLATRLDALDGGPVDLPSMASAVQEWQSAVAQWGARDDGLRGPSTGFDGLDRLWGGLVPGCLYTVAGRPGNGKSALAQQIAWRVAAEGGRVALFNFETDRPEILSKIYSACSGVPLSSILRGRLQAHERDLLGKVAAASARWPLHVWDQTACHPNTGSIRRRVSELVRRRGPVSLVVIDHAHCMSEPGFGPRDLPAMYGEVVWNAKRIAADFNTCVLLLAQANRAVDKAEGLPKMSDVKGAGAFEEHSHTTAFVLVEGEASRVASDEPREAKVLVRKNRNGQPNTLVPMRFRGASVRWEQT